MECLSTLKFKSKKKSFFASEQKRVDVQEKRKDYLAAVEELDPENFIFIDESGANLGMASEYARAEGGSRARAPKPFNSGEKFSIIGAIALTGIVGMMYIESATDGDAFKTFIRKCLIPHLEVGKFVILDNISFHKQSEIRELIEKAGSKVVFLPPYSPDLSPIEPMWSKIKQFLRKLMPRTKAEFHNALAESLAKLNPEDFKEWFMDCGYFI